MNPKWMKLASALLEQASDEFANHGCSDWSFPEDWTRAEGEEFALALLTWNAHGGAVNEEELAHMAEGPPDWFVMSFLAYCIGQEAP